MWTPDVIAKLQHATRTGKTETYQEYATLINDQTRRHMTLRGLFEIKAAGPAIALDEVEPAKEIVKRFATGAMSLGSISTEAHSTLSIAMNRIGGNLAPPRPHLRDFIAQAQPCLIFKQWLLRALGIGTIEQRRAIYQPLRGVVKIKQISR